MDRRNFWDPFTGLDVPNTLRQRVTYTGYLDRSVPRYASAVVQHLPKDFILVSAGGGGDGASLMHQVISAVQHDGATSQPYVLLLGPFMRTGDREQIHARASSLKQITVIDFDNRAEAILANAKGVVAMCGYNTFCEILSYNKRALIVPRTHPRREQEIRALRAQELGLVDMLQPTEADDPAVLADALRRLPKRSLPSEASRVVALDGLDTICDLVDNQFIDQRRSEFSLVASVLTSIRT